MVTVGEALNSEDPKLIKRLRGSICTQITCDVNLLSKELNKKQNGRFDLLNISHQLIKIQKKKLLEHFDTIQKLHDRYILVRDEGLTEELEQSLVEEDITYMENITLKVCPILDELNKYDEVFMEATKLKDMCKVKDNVRESCIKARNDFGVVLNKVTEEISHINELEDKSESKLKALQSFPAESLSKTLLSTFTELKKACNKLKENENAVGDSATESKVSSSYEKEYTDYLDADMKLKTYEQIRTPGGLRGDTSSSEGRKATPLKINKPDNLSFSGQARDFAMFKRDFMAIVVPHRDQAQIGIYFKQAIPEKHKHIISNKELHDWEGMMEAIEEELATPKIIVDQTVAEIERMKTPVSDKGFIEFVDSLEKIVRDLTTLNQLAEIANTSMISKLELRLPSQINHDWTQKVVKEKISKKTSREKFDHFMEFLKEAKQMTKYNVSLSVGNNKNHCFVTGTVAAQIQGEKKENRGTVGKVNSLPCLACSVDGATDLTTCMHSMGSCLVWASLSLQQRRDLVKCIKHPFSQDGHTTTECIRDLTRPCIHCGKINDHSSLLCPAFQVRKKSSANTSRRYVSIHELSDNPIAGSDLPPTLLYTQFTKTIGGRRLGTLIDNGSTDDYVLNQTARRLKLIGQPVELVTEGFGGIETRINTQLYYVPVFDRLGRKHYLPCYGTDKITGDSALPDVASYQRMCKKFGVNPRDVQRPKRIELLISLRSGHLHPHDSEAVEIGGMRLVNGPLGKVFGGTSTDLKFEPLKIACPTTAMQVDNGEVLRAQCMKTSVQQATYITPLQTDREILNFFNEEQMGVHFSPRCGDCRCGRCSLGGKQMSLKEEREYERFRSLMYLDVEGTVEDPGPYWRTNFPWTVEPRDLADNKAAVIAVMNSTERKLNKNISWREIYEEQLRTLIQKGFAREITQGEIMAWEQNGGKTFYIAHQMAVNPESKTTPIRCCFNSSQKYKGHSLNASWELGPDLVNSLHSILLRFRNDMVAAQGDITKMYYMVRITEKESWMQIFMWKFMGDDCI